MAIEKKGSPEKIKTVLKDIEQFESERELISNSADKIKCPVCFRLIAKKADDCVDIKYKDEIILVKKAEKISIKCPHCGAVINIL